MAEEKSLGKKGNPNTGKSVKEEKLSYEQLESVANSLNQKCRQLQEYARSLQQTISEFNEIGMLLDILGKSEHFKDSFVTRCSDKIEELVTRAMDASEKQEEKEEK
jgi:cell division protein ZapA (FtsZ GTPase activity inhibitor)